MRGKIAWPSLASFGGITRIRFKGFDRRFAPIISARRLPRTSILGQNKTRMCEVNVMMSGLLVDRRQHAHREMVATAGCWSRA